MSARRWPGYTREAQAYEMRTRGVKRGKTLDGIHAPTRAELEDLFRPPVIALAIASIRDETLEEDEERGCWHYDYDGFCVTCDPDTYEPSDDEDGGEA